MKRFLKFSFVLYAFLVSISTTYANTKIRFLVISDIHYGAHNSSKEGSDAGDELLNLSMNKMRQLSRDVNFILNLGDIPTHLLGYSPDKAGFEAAVFSGLLKADYLKKPMFYVSGNNDPIGGDYQPFLSYKVTPLNYAQGWRGACVYCEGLIIDDSAMRTGGYYSSYVVPKNKKIILIALNATQFMRQYIFLPKYPNQDHDAEQQLHWLRQQLKTHRADQLLIAMHEAPGADYKGNLMWKPQYLAQFLQILNQYQGHYKEITLLTSHSHMDEIRRIRLAGGRVLYGFSTPSISRIYRNNSAMKIYDLDAAYRLKQYTSFYTTTNENWGDDQYQAVGGDKAIFPNCANKTLVQCLIPLNREQVCGYLERGYYYSAKSERVNNKACNYVFEVFLTP